MITAVASKCDSLHTHLELRNLLVNAIQDWLQWSETKHDELFSVNPSGATNTTPVVRMITKQNAIGWHQVFLVGSVPTGARYRTRITPQ